MLFFYIIFNQLLIKYNECVGFEVFTMVNVLVWDCCVVMW
jgi:hypothetical protein